MSMGQRYAVLLTPDLESGGYSVTVPALPGCFTHGETVEEALHEVREAIACYVGVPHSASGAGEDRVEVIMATVAVAAG